MLGFSPNNNTNQYSPAYQKSINFTRYNNTNQYSPTSQKRINFTRFNGHMQIQEKKILLKD